MAAGLLTRLRIDGEIAALWGVEPRWAVSVPLMVSTVPGGFPSPADDYLDRPLDFNELLIANPASTFCVTLQGDSMVPLLMPGDRLVIDRSLTAVDRSIVLACLDGEFTIKRYRRRAGRCWLEAENPAYPPIPLTEDRAFEVWGVVWRSIRLLTP